MNPESLYRFVESQKTMFGLSLFQDSEETINSTRALIFMPQPIWSSGCLIV